MKVLHVIPSVGPNRGGPTFVLRTLARGLADAGIEVHVATTNDNGADLLDVPCGIPVTEGGVTYRYFPRQSRFYTVSLPLNRWLSRHVADYDIAHIHALFSFSSTIAGYWARRRRIPYLVRPLGTLNPWGIQNRRPWLKRLSLHTIERPLLASAAAVHYTSDSERSAAEKLGQVSRAEVIPNVVERSAARRLCGQFRARHPELNDRQLVLFLSRFDKIKGLDLLLPAIARISVHLPKTTLVLAGNGDPSFVANLREQCLTLGIARNVFWAGFLNDDAKLAALHDADVFVLPSYSENFGIAVAEAMSAAVPVVVSNQVAIHREVTASNAGIVVPCNVEELSDALLSLLNDPERRSQCGRNGEAFAQQHYSVQAVTRRLIRLYLEIREQARFGAMVGARQPAVR